MEKQKVFVTRKRHIEAIEFLKTYFQVEVWEGCDPPDKSTLMAKASHNQGLMTEIDDVIDAEVLRSSTTLKIVANRAAGVDNVDVVEATRLGVVVSNTPGILHETCADFTFGLILASARNIAFADRQVRKGAWERFDQSPYFGVDVFESTLGIIGLGQIGMALAKRARGFNMEVLYYSRTRNIGAEDKLGMNWVPNLSTLLQKSNFISVHVPLNADTYHLIGEKEFRQMKHEAIFINTSRGGTVDHDALYEALERSQIRGAAIDVTEPEPIPCGHPLLTLENVIITPHISSGSVETVSNMAQMAATNIFEVLTGSAASTCVNPRALRE